MDKAYSDFASVADESHNIAEKNIEERTAGFRLHAESEHCVRNPRTILCIIPMHEIPRSVFRYQPHSFARLLQFYIY